MLPKLETSNRAQESSNNAQDQDPDLPVTPGSGNVFADLGLAEPEEELTKAQLASHIRQTIQGRRLTRRSLPRSWPSTSRACRHCSTDALRTSRRIAWCS